MYETEGPISENPRTDLIKHLRGKAGPSGYGSNSTAAEVAKDWKGEGKVVIITGCNTGLGKEAAKVLAGQGAEVVMAVRNTSLGDAAAKDIQSKHPNAKLTVMACDLSSLASVKKFAEEFKRTGKPCHMLICNAGVMACPYMKTKDGHEMQYGTNHLGHFALVKQLLPVLSDTGAKSGAHSRVVVLSSAAHFNPYKKEHGGPIKFDHIDSEEGYNEWGAYGQSKLCNVLMTRELQRRLTAQGTPVTAVVCHPGVLLGQSPFLDRWPKHKESATGLLH
eukprot:GHUV01011275.1.p1 GENE.GHUV01011275.1~~GHUV01011275.1.p1  ORF type:complete len:277 (+),score=52.87 GHUV01011275.1:180-1010(+)